MNTIQQNRDFAECYTVQIVHHVVLIDLISSPMKSCLFLCRMSEKTIFISVDRKAIICGIPGKMELAFV